VLNLYEIQFLKHSPVRDVTGVLRPLLNLGVLLRLSGNCRGDLCNFGGKGVSLEQRAAVFQSSLLVSAYPRAHFNLIDNMKRRFPLGDRKVDLDYIFEYKVGDHSGYPSFWVPDSEVFQRYHLTQLQISEINLVFGNLGYGETLSTTGLDFILQVDYGLGCVFELPAPVLLPPWWAGQE